MLHNLVNGYHVLKECVDPDGRSIMFLENFGNTSASQMRVAIFHFKSKGVSENFEKPIQNKGS
jgi:hypothetical protein